MRNYLPIALATVSLFATSPALAAVFANGGDTATITFNGNQPGTSASLELTLSSDVNGLFTFNYTLTNTSNLALNPFARASGFGFQDGALVASSGSVTGDFDTIAIEGNPPPNPGGPGPIGDTHVCFSNGGNCSGSGGATVGTPATGTFTLQYGTGVTSIELAAFAVRYQSLGLRGQDSGTGVEVPSPVPEPATWGMMLMGFGAVGYGMRRRRRLPYQLA